MLLRRLICFVMLLTVLESRGEELLAGQVDSILSSRPEKPFNGVVVVAHGDRIIYREARGYADLPSGEKLTYNSPFVVGSVSKQFTAVLILQEYERGNIDLRAPVSAYLPELRQAWAGDVTVHHLLTHTHGITDLNGPLAYSPGSRFSYSQTGYDLLSRILERITGRSFVALSDSLFGACGMPATFHPESAAAGNPVNCYAENRSGRIVRELWSPALYPVAAGGFISDAGDLLRWNNCLFNGEVLNDSTLALMTACWPDAVRDHPVFGTTCYGYGMTAGDQVGVSQLGQTGYVSGFVTMAFYFPQTDMSVIMLENISYGSDLKESFYYHVELLNAVRSYIAGQLLPVS